MRKLVLSTAIFFLATSFTFAANNALDTNSDVTPELPMQLSDADLTQQDLLEHDDYKKPHSPHHKHHKKHRHLHYHKQFDQPIDQT